MLTLLARRTSAALPALAAAALLALAPLARGEMAEITVAKQYGIGYLPLMLMEEGGLIEKHAKAAGIDVKVTWATFAGGGVMNDALLSGGLQFASGGVGPMVTLWSRTRGNLDVRGVAALDSMPLYLVTRNPEVKTVKDLSDKDRIGLPAVKISVQALALQMAAEQAFGPGQQNRLDSLTVTMSHPDAMQALLSGRSEVDAHFGSPPFQYQELARPGMYRVLNNYDVMGGAVTFNVVWTTEKFRAENPKLYDAFVKALDEAQAAINRDRRGSAEAYLRISKDKDSLDNIVHMLNDPEIVFTTTPNNVMKYADFMFRTGAIKVKPESWKELFFPNVQGLPGS
ncbi:MAG TPA: ABC transporter substrate-binding protein [Casimicrobiaceae bacterium]|nr:ABC transporter substrate-binding protein [Casimicrobiaceae bacterium]